MTGFAMAAATRRDSPETVSVIIPCYNAARYLDDAITSVIAQDEAPIEIIVVDDGSTDGSAQVALASRGGVKLVRQANAGPNVARNAGVAASRGACVALLDADDLWPEGSLRERLRLLREDSHAGFAYGAVEHFFSPELTPSRRAGIALAPIRPARLPGAMLFRRAALDRIGLFDPTLRMGEMLDWTARATRAGMRGATTSALVLRRRIHGSNTVYAAEDYSANNLRALRAALAARRLGDDHDRAGSTIGTDCHG